ncbi:MAG: LPS export ABC transporter permease LptF [Nitrospirota bacterium]
MRLVDRYLLKELFPPFFLALTVFTLIMLTDRALRLTELVILKGVDISTVGLLFLYILPSFFAVTVPMAVLVAVLIAFGRLSAESEITAMAASGVSLGRLVPSVFSFCLIGAAITLWIMLSLLPAGNQAFKETMFQVVKTKATVGIHEGVFNDAFDGLVLYAQGVEGGNRLRGIFISNERTPKNPHILVAKEGVLLTDPDSLRVTLRLTDGAIHRLVPEREAYPVISFASNDVQLDLFGSRGGATTIPKGRREKTLSELSVEAATVKAAGGNASPLVVEIHKKFSIPAACLVFGLVGMPLGLTSRRSGKGSAFGLALAVIMVYYVFITAGENLAVDRKIPPGIAMWSPNVILGLLGAGLLYRARTGLPPSFSFRFLWTRETP